MPARVLLVLGLLVGLFGMHGLGADHHTAAPSPHATVSASSAVTAAHHPAPTPDQHVVPPSDPGSSEGHLMDVASACVAVLAGAALLALLLPGAVRILHPVRPSIDRSGARGRVPPLPALRPPDLSVLCVLRT